LNYQYNGAGLLIGMAQYALQHPESFTISDEAGMSTYRPKEEKFTDPDLKQMIKYIKSFTFDKSAPILLREIVMLADSGSGHSVIRMKYSYGPADFREADSFKPPLAVAQVPNRLKDRFVWP